MYQFASFFFDPATGDIKVWDLTSHGETERHLGLDPNGPYREGYYLLDGTIQARVTEDDAETGAACAARMRSRFPSLGAFLAWAVPQAKPGTTLDLDGTPVTELAPLAGLTQLTTLDLAGTPVTELAPLAGLTQLTTLYLGGTPVTELAPLAGLTQLTTLYLGWTKVTEPAPVAGQTQLTTLYLGGTKGRDLAPVTSPGLTIVREKRSLPSEETPQR